MASNIPSLFWQQVRESRNRVALKHVQGSAWQSVSWSQYGDTVSRTAWALQKLGIKKGNKIAIFSDNCPWWFYSDFAALTIGAVSVPLYPNVTSDQVDYILEHSEAQVVFVRGLERLDKIRNKDRFLKIVVIGENQPFREDNVESFDDFIKNQPTLSVAHEESANRLKPGDLATIVYTSGTTGNPKGVMLSHQNNYAEAQMLKKRVVRNRNSIYLSYLPVSHVAERLNEFRQVVIGYTVCFAESLETIGKNLLEVQPTTFVGVPRVYEKFEAGIRMKMSRAPQNRRNFFEKTIRIGTEVFELKKKNKISILKTIQWKILCYLVGKKVKQALGFERADGFFGGAAPLSQKTHAFFFSLGMPIHEAYGLTECSGASHVNTVGDPSFGTVGPVLDNMSCIVNPDGEILLKGDNIFLGYYKDKKATKEVLKDGWLHTGDIGVMEGSCLKITDRKKNIIVTAGGKNIAPAPLEQKLKQHTMVSQCVVIGDRRRCLTALLTLNEGLNLDDAGPKIRKHVEAVNKTLASYETIKKFSLLENDLTIEGGELTPSMKIKRSVVEKKYKKIIDAMYEPEKQSANKDGLKQAVDLDIG
jgi:long-chain acyl-CoA synthetase